MIFLFIIGLVLLFFGLGCDCINSRLAVRHRCGGDNIRNISPIILAPFLLNCIGLNMIFFAVENLKWIWFVAFLIFALVFHVGCLSLFKPEASD